jgi:hypothetical protein
VDTQDTGDDAVQCVTEVPFLIGLSECQPGRCRDRKAIGTQDLREWATSDFLSRIDEIEVAWRSEYECSHFFPLSKPLEETGHLNEFNQVARQPPKCVGLGFVQEAEGAPDPRSPVPCLLNRGISGKSKTS